jgi:hypothetical protein
MHTLSRHRLVALVASMIGFASAAHAQTACVLEYRRADNMWANWGRPDGLLGTETITLQPGQKKIFLTDWSHEKLRNDGTTFYGSHLRRAVNRGTGPLQFRVRGPGSMFAWVKAAANMATNVSTTFSNALVGEGVQYAIHIVVGSSPTFQPGDSALFRHDLAEVSCPGTATLVSASVAPAPAPPVVLSLTGARTTTGSTVTVTANDAGTGAALAGQVSINGATGPVGQAIAFTPCSETVEYEDTRGVTRTRTVRVPCEGTVQIGGYPNTSFNF